MKYVVNFDTDNCDVYIGRSSKFGSPFCIGIDGTREDVLQRYESYLYGNKKLLQAVCQELPGKVLGCHCKPYYDCHGDLLDRIANGGQLCLPLV